MTKSMTAFAKNRFCVQNRYYQLEISSLNRKGLEVYVNAPREFSFLEAPFRQQIAAVCDRGQVVLKLNPEEAGKGKISPDQFVKSFTELREVAKGLDSRFEVTFENVLQWILQGDFSFEVEEEEFTRAAQKALGLAIQDWLAMKKVEGDNLANDLLGRLNLIQSALHKIAQGKERAVSRFREKLLEKIQELKEIADEDRERILREVVIYAEKVDISEEITRLESHIHQVKTLFGKKGESIGRGLDFLIREMGREANTISSKATDLSVIHDALFIKEEIEKMREQVQNIE